MSGRCTSRFYVVVVVAPPEVYDPAILCSIEGLSLKSLHSGLVVGGHDRRHNGEDGTRGLTCRTKHKWLKSSSVDSTLRIESAAEFRVLYCKTLCPLASPHRRVVAMVFDVCQSSRIDIQFVGFEFVAEDQIRGSVYSTAPLQTFNRNNMHTFTPSIDLAVNIQKGSSIPISNYNSNPCAARKRP
ncbi:hypothetical protein EVAR_79857_1 [Eumeta japonica]|uniref:Uncharacterized protein n=1 Tax=Eumeta variegata TaxID=151549 RepID=A0A4C1TZ25_EUMVA|nr:hypothetical protein EVAR_79857_1 [Eumeta japonica]